MTKNMLKALSSDTRREILNELKKGSRTPSDLSRILSKHKSTVVEHLEKLMSAGLVSKNVRPGKKWVFYSLTDDGGKMFDRSSNRLFIILGITFLAFLTGSYSVYRYVSQPTFYSLGGTPMMENAQKAADSGLSQMLDSRYLYASIALFSLSAIGIFSLIFLQMKKRKRVFE